MSRYADNIFKSFRAGCKDGIAESQSHIDEALEKFEADSNLYKNEPRDSYSMDMGSKFESVDSYDDIERNTDYLHRVLRADMLYYLIHG